MKKDSIRTSIDLPRELHQRLHEAARRSGTSARRLVLRSIENTINELCPQRPTRRLSLEEPIVPSRGKPFDLTSDQIHELIDFP